MSLEAPPLLLHRDGPVARIVFNRPQALNAIDADIAQRFLTACRAIADDSGIRVVTMQGAGRAFVAGGDIKAFKRNPAGIADELIGPMHEGLSLLSGISAPVVAALHGPVAGAGLSLALACDLAIAAEDVRLDMAYLKVGASCDLGASWTLPRIVGLRRATAIALLNPVLDAAEALHLGLVNQVVPVDELPSAVDAIATRIAAGPPVATGQMKRLLREGASRTFAGQLAAERAAFATCAATADFGEALDAFLEKRSARYQGR